MGRSKKIEIETIHESLVNGQRRQMVKQIKQYGLYDFWSDYKDYLDERHINIGFFRDAVISYFRITAR